MNRIQYKKKKKFNLKVQICDRVFTCISIKSKVQNSSMPRTNFSFHSVQEKFIIAGHNVFILFIFFVSSRRIMVSTVFRENPYDRGHVAFLYFKVRRNFAEWKRTGEIGIRGESKSVVNVHFSSSLWAGTFVENNQKLALVWRSSCALITVTRSSIGQRRD